MGFKIWRAVFSRMLLPEQLARSSAPRPLPGHVPQVLAAGTGYGYLLELEGKPHCIAWWDRVREPEIADWGDPSKNARPVIGR